MHFHLFAIHMPGYVYVGLKRECSSQAGNSSLFKPSVMQPISQTTFDPNNEPCNNQTGFGPLKY